MSETKHTPGKWFIRERREDDELADCFVAAPDVNGFPYDAEILGDDEYREQSGGVARKLADCLHIVTACNSHAALVTALEGVSKKAAEECPGDEIETWDDRDEIEIRLTIGEIRAIDAALAQAQAGKGKVR